MKKSLGAKVLVCPTPVWVVGTFDKDGKPNAMTAAWAGVCCSAPPCVGVALRKATYSYANIVARKAFTVSIPSEKHIAEADYLGIASGRNEDKFAKAHLTPVKSTLVDAPFVSEFPLVVECRLLHALEIGLHTWFVGEILDVKAEEGIADDPATPYIEKVKPLIFSPEARTYHGVGKFLGKAFSAGLKLR